MCFSPVTKAFGRVLRYMSNVRTFVADAVTAMLPAKIGNVWHLSHCSEGKHEHEFVHLYNGRANWWKWSRGMHRTMFAPSSGYYLIQTLNTNMGKTAYHFLSASKLSTAIQSRNLSNWWAFSDFGICTLLSSFFIACNPDTKRIFAIMINGKDATNDLKPYMSSIVIDNNITAAALCDLWAFIKKIPRKKHETNSVTLVNYDFEEHIYKGNEFLFPQAR